MTLPASSTLPDVSGQHRGIAGVKDEPGGGGGPAEGGTGQPAEQAGTHHRRLPTPLSAKQDCKYRA